MSDIKKLSDIKKHNTTGSNFLGSYIFTVACCGLVSEGWKHPKHVPGVEELRFQSKCKMKE